VHLGSTGALVVFGGSRPLEVQRHCQVPSSARCNGGRIKFRLKTPRTPDTEKEKPVLFLLSAGVPCRKLPWHIESLG